MLTHEEENELIKKAEDELTDHSSDAVLAAKSAIQGLLAAGKISAEVAERAIARAHLLIE